MNHTPSTRQELLTHYISQRLESSFTPHKINTATRKHFLTCQKVLPAKFMNITTHPCHLTERHNLNFVTFPIHRQTTLVEPSRSSRTQRTRSRPLLAILDLRRHPILYLGPRPSNYQPTTYRCHSGFPALKFSACFTWISRCIYPRPSVIRRCSPCTTRLVRMRNYKNC